MLDKNSSADNISVTAATILFCVFINTFNQKYITIKCTGVFSNNNMVVVKNGTFQRTIFTTPLQSPRLKKANCRLNGMKQTNLGLDLSTQRTRKQILLGEMNQVMPWDDLLSLIAPHGPVAKTERPPFDLELVVSTHCLQQWFGLSDLGIMSKTQFESQA